MNNMKGLNRYIKESLLDDEDDLVGNNFDFVVKDWLKTVKDRNGDRVDLSKIIIDSKTSTVDTYSKHMRGGFDLNFESAPPKEIKHIMSVRAHIMFDLDEETVKKFERPQWSPESSPINSYFNKSGFLNNLQFDNDSILNITGNVKKIKNLSLIGGCAFSKSGKIIEFHNKVDLELKDLVEISSDYKFYIIISEKSKLSKSIQKEYTELGFEEFNKKYKDILDNMIENNLHGIIFRKSSRAITKDDLMCLTNPTDFKYKHMWCTRAEYDDFNS